MKKLFILLLAVAGMGTQLPLQAQLLDGAPKAFTHQDTLRGTDGPARSWWNVTRYDISFQPDYTAKTIKGVTKIGFTVTAAKAHPDTMQIDLMRPLQIDSIILPDGSHITGIRDDGNAHMVPVPKWQQGTTSSLTIYYHGSPIEAVKPPWDGGFIWAKDSLGRPWMSVACQGMGASVWYPCKDYQGDEPDNGASLTSIVPDTLLAIGNGHLIAKTRYPDHLTGYTWQVKNPINNYDIIPYIGKYTFFDSSYQGEKGRLPVSFWALDYDIDKMRSHCEPDVFKMLKAFEYWFGPYPFYEDGYKLVQAPHLGMEHQSAIAYGNHFLMGYSGRDLSHTGIGLKFDFIVVHESGHEWFGNNITTKDIADMWVHESFTNYSETLFTEYYWGKAAGQQYVNGIRANIENDRPIQGHYGVNQEGSGDMYYKGANMINNIRNAINNDSLFRSILRGLNETFYHQTVTGRQIEQYINEKSNINFDKVFEQYLTTTQIPVFEIKFSSDNKSVQYRYSNCVAGFDMPMVLTSTDQQTQISLHPTTAWQSAKLPTAAIANLFNPIAIEYQYYLDCKEVH
ncbi:Peptidase family M1 [Arachidicoccus rhizosphaerae]|uniref:Peptidase family M1 n=1 Tax=Arachidicoccus rhizosphaerae TaxID=551991 RepID=A0A1H4CJ40_9BACT|nr:M1 family metallopeptidase [Arachidicoccus rhizosphaerae]SEA60349.1 Peptidase family M1 [Arachidicoccus rhizosphaerae]